MGRAGDELKLTGFTSLPAAVLDITDPDQPVELTPRISLDKISPDKISPEKTTWDTNSNHYALEVQVPWSTNSAGPSRHTLLAVPSHRLASVAGLRPKPPSSLRRPHPGSQTCILPYRAF